MRSQNQNIYAWQCGRHFERTARSYPFPKVVLGWSEENTTDGQNSSGDIQYHYRYRRRVSSITSTARHHKSRVAAMRFWFRQLTPPADNFRHIRSCRRDLALHFLLPPDHCGASRHTNSPIRHKSRYEGSETSSPCGGTPVIIVPSFPHSLGIFCVCSLRSLSPFFF